MAFDTQNQRRSALNSAVRLNLPIAVGVIGLDARAMRLFQYAHDSFPVPEDNWFPQNAVDGEWAARNAVSGDWSDQEDV